MSTIRTFTDGQRLRPVPYSNQGHGCDQADCRRPRERTLRMAASMLKVVLSSSLRTRLIVLALVAAMPVAAVIIHTGLDERREARSEERRVGKEWRGRGAREP